MFCNQCGAELQPGQTYCARCGKAAVGLVVTQANRVRGHVKLVGILWMAYSTLQAIGGLMAILFARLVIARLVVIPNGPPPELFLWLRPLLGVIGWLILVKGAAGFFTGWGLLQREAWARVLALVMGFLALLSVPIGTALGVYTLWVLLPSESEREYEQMAAGG